MKLASGICLLWGEREGSAAGCSREEDGAMMLFSSPNIEIVGRLNFTSLAKLKLGALNRAEG